MKINGRNIAECSAMQISDRGPGAGHDGGRVVFTGTPADLVARGDTVTVRHLRDYVESSGA